MSFRYAIIGVCGAHALRGEGRLNALGTQEFDLSMEEMGACLVHLSQYVFHVPTVELK